MRARASATPLQFSRKMTPRPSPRGEPLLNLAVEIQGTSHEFRRHDFHDLLGVKPRFWRKDRQHAGDLGLRRCGLARARGPGPSRTPAAGRTFSIFIVQLFIPREITMCWYMGTTHW